MAAPFSQTARAMRLDDHRISLLALVVAILVGVLWVQWFVHTPASQSLTSFKVSKDIHTTTYRSNVNDKLGRAHQAAGHLQHTIYAHYPLAQLGQIYAGQKAIIHVSNSFRSQGAVAAYVLRVEKNPKKGNDEGLVTLQTDQITEDYDSLAAVNPDRVVIELAQKNPMKWLFDKEKISGKNFEFANLTLAGHTFEVQLADSPEKQHQGLMDKPYLRENTGMLFMYDQPKLHDYWLENILIPLDMLFFDGNRKLQDIVTFSPPCQTRPCAKFSTPPNTQYVLELPAGSLAKLKLKSGDVFQLMKNTEAN